MKYDFTCPQCSTDMLVKDWRHSYLTGSREPWCWCVKCKYKCFAKMNTINTVHLVVIDDMSDYITQTKVDSVWYDWKDACKRVQELNSSFKEDHDMHAYYFEKEIK